MYMYCVCVWLVNRFACFLALRGDVLQRGLGRNVRATYSMSDSFESLEKSFVRLLEVKLGFDG
jgi:hypothetical protein